MGNGLRLGNAADFIAEARRMMQANAAQGTPATGAESTAFDNSEIGQFFNRLTIPRALFTQRGAGSKNDIGWMLALDPGWRDRNMTAELTELHAAAKTRQGALPPNANDFAYHFVGGLFTKRYPGYFSENVRRLKERGMEHISKSEINTDVSVAVNLEVIKNELLRIHAETGKKVVVIGHSKGGVDVAAALERYPELWDKVQAFIPMQSPAGGTPIASDIDENANLKELIGGFIKNAFSGELSALTDLSYKSTRERFGGKVEFTRHVPTFSLASWSHSAASLTALPALYGRQRYGKEGDGLVLMDDAIFPHSRGVVLLDELDHAGPAMGGSNFARWKPGDITEALVALALKHTT